MDFVEKNIKLALEKLNKEDKKLADAVLDNDYFIAYVDVLHDGDKDVLIDTTNHFITDYDYFMNNVADLYVKFTSITKWYDC